MRTGRVLGRAGLTTAITAAALTLGLVGLGLGNAADFGYKTVSIPGSSGGAEPRVSVDPNGRFWVYTNAPTNDAVFTSADGVTGWTKTAADPPNQTSPTTDVDIITLPSGRIVATELDYAGINFRTAYSDDGGKTWTASTGTEYADTDRPWLAADPAPGSNKVYLLFHNLASGAGTHNMFVATSTDGGATFGPPVPTTLPGAQAWSDLQCADSGGPSNIFVAPPGSKHAGRVYAVWGTRSSGKVAGTVDSSPTGGCGASATGTFEINVVGATKIWTAYSDTPAVPGSWHQSVAVDDNATGQLVGSQLPEGTVDNQGNVYVGYTESPKPYPNYDGAAVKYVYAGPDLDAWSAPVTVAAGGTYGHVLPHIIAGDPGNLALAYWTGQNDGSDASPVIHWYQTMARVTDGLSDRPEVLEHRVSNISAETGTASQLMGACDSNPTTAGVKGGFVCSRTADVFGIALTPKCYVTMVWPVRRNTIGAKQLTMETTQTSGLPLCKPSAGASGATAGAAVLRGAASRHLHRARR